MFDEPDIAQAIKAYLLETAPVIAFTLNDALHVVEANEQALHFLCGECRGRPFAELIVDFASTIDLPSLIRQAGTVHRLTLSCASGLPDTFSFRFFPLSEGTLALGSLDFTEQLKLRDEILGLNHELNNLTRKLHQANAELRERNEVKNRFIGMAAHDLRKPIGVIITYCDFLLDEAANRLDDEQRGFLLTSLSAAEGMKRLIDNFLDVSVIESGHLRLECSRTDVAQILYDVLPMVRLLAAKKEIQLITEAGSDTCQLFVDGAKIHQVLVNLVGNAIEHSKAGQRVWLGACLADTEMVFSVRDEGPGIALADQKHLFAPFANAGTRKTAGERSVGLGLAIARQVVEAHRGRIWVESFAGEGANFRFALPVGVNQPTKEKEQT